MTNPKLFLYMGQKLTDMTKEQLIEAVIYLHETNVRLTACNQKVINLNFKAIEMIRQINAK